MASSDVIQCPRCRTINYPGLMGYPRCHKCHEQLRQCLHCRHQSGGLCMLEDASRPPLLAEEQLPYCRAFSSRHARGAAVPWWQRPLLGTQRVMVLGLVVGAVALVAGWLLRSPEPPPNKLVADADVVYLTGRAAGFGMWVYANADELDDVTVEVVPERPEAYWLIADPVPSEPLLDRRPRLRYRMPSGGRIRLDLEFRARVAIPPAQRIELRLLDPAGHVLDVVSVELLPVSGAPSGRPAAEAGRQR